MLAARGVKVRTIPRRRANSERSAAQSRRKSTTRSRCCASVWRIAAAEQTARRRLRRRAGGCGEGRPASRPALEPTGISQHRRPATRSTCAAAGRRRAGDLRELHRQHGALALDAGEPRALLRLGQRARADDQGLQEGQAGAVREDRGRQAESPTPIFSANMLFVIFHPSWGVPPGMKANELLPQLSQRRRRLVLRLRRRLLGAEAPRPARDAAAASPSIPTRSTGRASTSAAIDFVQPPGPAERARHRQVPLPQQARRLHARHAASGNLFGGAIRAFSHGCMRVQNPIRLAEVLLAHDKGWSADEGAGVRAARRRDQAHHAHPRAHHLLHRGGRRRRQAALSARHLRHGWPRRLRAGRRAVNMAAASVDKSDAPKPEATPTGEPPAKAKSRSKQKAASSQGFNPFSAIFGN